MTPLEFDVREKYFTEYNLRDLMRQTFNGIKPWLLSDISSMFDDPGAYVHKSALNKVRYQHVYLSDGWRRSEPMDLPIGIMPESDYFLCLYENYPIDNVTTELMRPRRTFRQWLKREMPLSPISRPEALAISSIELQASKSNPIDLFLRVKDFHASSFSTPGDMGRKSYQDSRIGLGFLRWTRLFVDMTEQLALYFNAKNEKQIRAILINHYCIGEKPSRDGQGSFKGERIAGEKGYIDYGNFSYKLVTDLITDRSFERSIQIQKV